MATTVETAARHTSSKRKQRSKKNKQNLEQKFSISEINNIPVPITEEEFENELALAWPEQDTNQQELEESARYLNKLETLQFTLEKDLLACDAKWTLFVSAAFSYRYDTVLQPYPPQFATETICDIDGLISVIKDTPKLSIVLENLMAQSYAEITSEVIDLLYWVLIEMGEPTLRLLAVEEFNCLLHSIDEKSLKIKPTHVFEVQDLNGFHAESRFNSRTSKLAFMGNKLDNYFSLLQNGFAALTLENKNTFKLTTDLQTSLKHSPYCAAWGASQCGSIIACTGVCELALNTQEIEIFTNKKDASCVNIHLNNAHHMRLRYLIFYGRRFPRNSFAKRGIFSWIYNHKFSLSLLSYMLVLLTIGVTNSSSGELFKQYVTQKLEVALSFCRRIISRDPSL